MAELDSLLQEEIPNGRKALVEGKANLESVANYCQQLYVDVSEQAIWYLKVPSLFIRYNLNLIATRKCRKHLQDSESSGQVYARTILLPCSSMYTYII